MCLHHSTRGTCTKMTSTSLTCLLLTSILVLVTTEATSTRLLERLLQPAISQAVARLEAEERRLEVTGLEQEGCSLVWSVAPSSVGVLYLVAGEDRAGMLSLVASSLQQPRLQLRPALLARFQRVRVVAVTRGGLIQTSSITINTVENCGDQDHIQTGATDPREEGNTQDKEEEAAEVVMETETASETEEMETEVEKVGIRMVTALPSSWVLAAAVFLVLALVLALVCCCTRHGRDKLAGGGEEVTREAFLVQEV